MANNEPHKQRVNSAFKGDISEREMARVTGLEPATSGVTGRHSNRLSYTRAPQTFICVFPRNRMARVTGLEPATSGVTGRHSNQLSYTRLS